MPFNDNECFYQKAIELAGAQITHRLIDATTTFDAFSFQDARELICDRGVHEYLVTSLTGANDDLVFIARYPGVQSVSVELVDPSANNAAAGVTVTGSALTVNLATDGAGAITTTAAQLKALVEGDADANDLVVISFASGNDGSGVVTALASTPLGGPAGTTPTLDVELVSSMNGKTFTSINAKFDQVGDLSEAQSLFSNLGLSGQWVVTLGGTNPVFAISLSAIYKP